MAVEVSNKIDLKDRIKKGINTLVDSISSTIGPGGRNVLIQDADGTIRITKDGVSVARAFTSVKDPVENVAIQLVKTVANKAVDKAGDGTSTASLLTQVIINDGFKAIDEKSNPVQVKVGIDKAVKAVVKKLKEISEDIHTEDQIKQVARLSANGDDQIADVIAQALDYVGEDGAVSIEESKTAETTLEKVEGMVFERGMKSPYFSTDPTKNEAYLSKPYVLIVNGRIMANNQLVDLLNYVANQDRSLLVIAEDVDSEALATLIVNKSRGILKVCAVKAPEFGDRRTAALEDIAVLTGGTVISEVKGLRLDKIKGQQWANYLGECRVATITATDTTLVDGKPKMSKEEDGFEEDGVTVKYKEINPVETRLLELKTQLETAKSAFQIENIQSRIAKLTGGVAIINVGGISEVEMRERKDRVDDALHATKAAIMEGVVPGGGMALINCESALDELEMANKDQKVGLEIVRKALYAPFNKILTNAGYENPAEILNKAIFNRDENGGIWSGYNVRDGVYVNLKEAGVVDPTKVTRTALENAASISGTILTTTSCVFEVPEPVNNQNENQQYQ